MGSKKSVTIGYRYFMGMHLAICHGPVDEVQRIIVGERTAWSGSVTASRAISINNPNLFGGEKKEGGIQGTVDIAMGEPTQGKNGYLQARLGSNIPAFRGTLALVLRRCYLTAMTRNIKPWAVRVKRCAARSWYPATCEIVGVGSSGDAGYIPGGSSNGVHIMYEALTNPDWGLGLPSTLLNDTAFREAADICFAENFGLSMLFSKQTSVEDFIQTILQHIGAMLYTDNATGQFVLKMIRPPSQQELDDALVFDENNIVEYTNFERPSFGEMINEVIVNYRPQGALKDSTITLQDLASVEAEQGLVSQTVQFPGVDNPTIASRVAARELSQYSTPLAKIQFTTNREGWQVTPGMIIKYKNPELGLENLIMRVFSVNYGTLRNAEITIDGTQDIYSLPQTSYLASQDTNWVEPVQLPLPSPATALFELPYYEIATNFSDGDQATFDEFTSFLQVMASTPLSASASYQLWLSATTPLANYTFDIDGNYTSTVTIVDALNIPKNGNNQTVTFTNGTGVFFEIEPGTYAYLNNEVVEVVSLDVDGLTVTLKRAILDTVPQVHAPGGILYFAETESAQASAQFVGDPVTGIGGDLTYARLLTQTDIGVLPLADATELSINFSGRQTRPLPPMAVTIQSQTYPTARSRLNGGGTMYAWRSRDRLLQITKPYNSWYSTLGLNTSEFGADFYSNIYNENNNLVRSIKHNRILSGNTYGSSYISLHETRDSSLITPGNFIEISKTGGNPSPLVTQFAETNNDHRARPDIPLSYSNKVYAEFNLTTASVSLGVTNNFGAYRQQDITNVAYLQLNTNTLIGQATGTPGTGVMDGTGRAAIAIDLDNKKFWLRNTNGTWRDGNPVTNTGGVSFSTLAPTLTDQNFFFFGIANDAVSAPTSATTITFNLGTSNFHHDIPSGFVAYQSNPQPETLVDQVSLGAGLSVGADGLSVTAVNPGTWTRAKATAIKSEGRWYFEVIPTRIVETSRLYIGVQPSTSPISGIIGSIGEAGWGANGTLRINGVNTSSSDTYAVGDRIGVAVDTYANQVRFFKNGEAIGIVHTLTVSTNIVPVVNILINSADVRFDFNYTPLIGENTSPPFKYALYNISDGPDHERLNNNLRIELWSAKEVTFNPGTIEAETVLIESMQRFDHTFDRNGWGYQYGNYYGGGNE